MLASLFGGRLYVQIHYDIYYSSDLENEYYLWVVSFVLEVMGEVMLQVSMWIWYSFEFFDDMYVVIPLVVLRERRLHETSPFVRVIGHG